MNGKRKKGERIDLNDVKTFIAANPNAPQKKIAEHFGTYQSNISQVIKRIKDSDLIEFESLRENKFLSDNRHDYISKMHKLTEDTENVKCPSCKHVFAVWRGNFYAIKEMNILAGNYNINRANDKDNGDANKPIAIVIRQDFSKPNAPIPLDNAIPTNNKTQAQALNHSAGEKSDPGGSNGNQEPGV